MIDRESGSQIKRAQRITYCLHDQILGDGEGAGEHEGNGDQIMRENEGEFFKISGSDIMIEMKDFPERKYQQLRGEKKDPLITKPIRISQLCNIFMESQNREGSQIHIMFEFLGGCMMFAVLIDPIISTSSDTSAKDDKMCDFVKGHVTKESTMSHIMH